MYECVVLINALVFHFVDVCDFVLCVFEILFSIKATLFK